MWHTKMTMLMDEKKGTIEMQEQRQPALCKTANDVQRAHDLLGALLKQILKTPGLSQLPVMDVEQAFGLGARYSVLCWMLGHENREFSEYLESLEQVLAEGGAVLIDIGELHYPQEVRDGH